jgi:hypothetical protein
MKGNASLINEIYSKCLNQSQDILDRINEIENGTHDMVLDKIKMKIIEKLENFENSLKLGEQIITEMDVTESMKWKR